MRTIRILGATLALFASSFLCRAQEMPKMPPPVKEHEWLQKFVGEWELESEAAMEPGKPPVKGKGSEVIRPIGGFWVIAEGKSEIMGMPFTSVLTLGYDPESKKYVGTWVDSVTSRLWKYDGVVSEDGKKLTLETEGPCPMREGKLTKFKEVIEFKDNDHRVFSSSVLGEDDKWMTVITVTATRKK